MPAFTVRELTDLLNCLSPDAQVLISVAVPGDLERGAEPAVAPAIAAVSVATPAAGDRNVMLINHVCDKSGKPCYDAVPSFQRLLVDPSNGVEAATRDAVSQCEVPMTYAAEFVERERLRGSLQAIEDLISGERKTGELDEA